MKRYIVIMHGGDVRECTLENGAYVHVLHRAWQVLTTDSRIKRVKEL